MDFSAGQILSDPKLCAFSSAHERVAHTILNSWEGFGMGKAWGSDARNSSRPEKKEKTHRTCQGA